MGGYGSAVADEMMKRADEIHAENKQKKDEEHARKISDLILERQELVNKIPTLQQNSPEYLEAHTALQGVNGDIADVYHPQKNPGAIEKFGHLLTDHLKLTNPQDRLQKETAQKQTRTDAAAKETDRQITAAPLSLAQQNSQKMRAQLDEIEKSDLSDDDKTLAKEKVFGVTSKPNMQQYTLPDGKTVVWADVNRPETIPPGATAVLKGSQTTAKETIAEYQKQVADGTTTLSYPAWVTEQRRVGAPSTSAINEGREDYSKSHGFKGWNDLPDEYRDVAMNYMIKKQAMDKTYPTSTTSSHLQQDAAGQYHNVTETNYKTPGGMESLKDPLWFLAPPVPGPNDAVQQKKKGETAATPSNGASTAPKTPNDPKALKKEASAHAPKPTSGGGNAPKSSTDGSTTLGNVKVSAPLFAGKNKEYDDAQSAYDSAIARVHTMEKSAKEAAGGDQQAMLSLVANHIGMTLGAQKGARINQAVWNEAVESAPGMDKVLAKFGHFDTNGDWVLDTPFKGYKGGVTLTGDQIKSMVKLAHEQVGTFKDNRDQILKRLNQGVQVPIQAPDGGEQPKKAVVPKGATHRKQYQGKWYYTDDKGKNLGEVTQ